MHLSHRTFFALSALAGIVASGSAFAHGTLSKPSSRVYACYQGNPENPTHPACAAAKAIGGAQMASCAAVATASTAAWT